MAKYKNRYQEDYDDELETAPPKITDYLSEWIVKVIPQIKGRGLPDFMPFNPQQAAQWWIEHQEPCDERAERIEKMTKDGRFLCWKTPYHERLKHTLIKFLFLEKPQQLYVIEAHKSGIPWRGDDFPFYISVMREHIKMVEQGKEAYMPEAIKTMKEARIGEIPCG